MNNELQANVSHGEFGSVTIRTRCIRPELDPAFVQLEIAVLQQRSQGGQDRKPVDDEVQAGQPPAREKLLVGR
jgi:hypothetical protein